MMNSCLTARPTIGTVKTENKPDGKIPVRDYAHLLTFITY